MKRQQTAWNKLSIKEKAAYIGRSVSNGIYDIGKIREEYNKFDEGGPGKFTSNTGYDIGFNHPNKEDEYFDVLPASEIVADRPGKMRGWSNAKMQRYAQGFRWGRDNVAEPRNEVAQRMLPYILGATTGGSAGIIGALAGEGVNVGVNAATKGKKETWGDLFADPKKHVGWNMFWNMTNPGYFLTGPLMNSVKTSPMRTADERFAIRNSIGGPGIYKNTPSTLRNVFNNESDAYKIAKDSAIKHFSPYFDKGSLTQEGRSAINSARRQLAKHLDGYPEGIKKQVVEDPDLIDALIQQYRAYKTFPKDLNTVNDITISRVIDRVKNESITEPRRWRAAKKIADMLEPIDNSDIQNEQLRAIADISPSYAADIRFGEAIGDSPEEIVKGLLDKKYTFVRGINFRDANGLTEEQLKDAIARIPSSDISTGGRADSQLFRGVDFKSEDIGYLQNSVPSAIAYTYPELSGRGVLAVVKRDPKTFDLSSKDIVDWWRANDFPDDVLKEAKSTSTRYGYNTDLRQYPLMEMAFKKYRARDRYGNGYFNFANMVNEHMASNGHVQPYRHFLIRGNRGDRYPIGLYVSDVFDVPKGIGNDFDSFVQDFSKRIPYGFDVDDPVLFSRSHTNMPSSGMSLGRAYGGPLIYPFSKKPTPVVRYAGGGFKDGLMKLFAPKYTQEEFGDAFAAARSDGQRYFRWNGNRYNTNTKEQEQMMENTIDWSGIQTTGGRKYNVDYINYINNSLEKSGIDSLHRSAILGNIIEESGGDPFAIDSTKTYSGLLQWGPDRYVIGDEKDPYREIDNQLAYFLSTQGNLTDKKSWTHGGKGSGYNSLKDAYNRYSTADNLEDVMHALTWGYVRPAGKQDSYNNRLRVARQVYDRYNKQ